jgi:hypothetical protein
VRSLRRRDCLFGPSTRDTDAGVNDKMGRLSRASVLLPVLATVLAPASAQSELVWDNTEKPLTGEDTFDKAACPNYAHYAAYPQ